MPAKKLDEPTPETPEAPMTPATGGVVQEPVATVAGESGCTYRFTYRDTTIYADLGLTVEHGDLHDWPDGPPNDGRWTLASEKE